MTESLQGFFKEKAKIITEVEYIAAKRFTDEEGNPLVWRIRVLSNKELEALRARFTKKVYQPGSRTGENKFNNEAFLEELMVRSVVFPTLDDMELQNSWGVSNELDLVKAMLNGGELLDLNMAIQEAHGYETGFDDKLKEVKNS